MIKQTVVEILARFDHVSDIVTRITYKDWRFVLCTIDQFTLYLQVQFTDDGHLHKGRKWVLSQHMTDSEVVQTALLAVLVAEEHEAREHFEYMGQAIYGPHKSADDMARHPAKLDVRRENE